MWKDSLSFSRREQKGITVVLFIIVLLIFLRLILPVVFSTSGDVVSKLDSLYFIVDPVEPTIVHSDLSSAPPKLELSVFDPNTVTSEFLVQVGVRQRVADNWHNYLQKGGIFNSPEDVRKVYGMDSVLLAYLLPYMTIKEPPISKNSFEKPEILAKMSIDTLIMPEKTPIPKYVRNDLDFIIDINSADTSELMLLRGIGPVLSRRIVYYRKQLGGFATTTQLLEIDGIMPKVLEDNANNIMVDIDLIIPMNINTASIRQLRDHPYLDFYKAKAIVDKRKKNQFTKIEEILDLEPFSEIDRDIIQYYLSVK